MIDRHGQAGVTLLEMLAALAVSSLIGIAGFTLLDGVLKTEAGVADRLDHLERQDRAFQLLALDLEAANGFEVTGEGQITLRYLAYSIVWNASSKGVERRIIWPDRADLTQQLLSDPAQVSVSADQPNLLRLSLPTDAVWRLFPIPQRNAL